MDFIAIDFETATSDRNSPCELGLTFVSNRKIVDTKSWLIKPTQFPYFNPFNISIHGITPDDVKDSPEFPELWNEVFPLVEGKTLIAHNASFDFSVLRNTLDAYKIKYPSLNYACSYTFSKNVWAGLPGYDLKTLCRTHNIKLRHHRAAADSLAAAEVSLLAFNTAGITSFDEFPDKLKTSLGRLYEGGYNPSSSTANKSIKTIAGDPSKQNPDSIFFGRNVVFTGTLSSMSRAAAFQTIADIGGIISNSVGKKTDFLVVGQQDYRVVGDDGMSSKQEKAVELLAKGAIIEVISEDDFLRNL